MDTLYYLFGTLIFIAVVLFIEGAYLTWSSTKGPEAGRIARRLRIMSAGAHASDTDISIVKERLLSQSPAMQRLLLRMPRVSMMSLICAGVNSGFMESKRAMAPVTCEVAIEVPLISRCLPLNHAEIMRSPGA